MAAKDLRRVLPYVRPYWKHLGWMLFGALGSQIFAVFIPLVIKEMIDGPLANGNRDEIFKWTVLVLALGIAEGFLLFMRRFLLARAASTMEMQMRDDLYAHLQRLSLRFHGRWQSGQLLSRAMSDANLIFREFVVFCAVYFVANVLTFVAVCGLLISLHVWLGVLVALGAIPVVIVSESFRLRYEKAARLVQDREGDIGTFVEESALGVRVITTFGRQETVGESFAEKGEDLRRAAIDAVRLRARFRALLGLVPNVVMALVLIGGAFAVANGSLSIGGLVAFFSLLFMLVWPVESMGEILSLTHESSTAAERIYEVFDSEPEITDRHGAKTIDRIEGRIEFDNVVFAFPDREPVLSGIDLVVEPGETIAFVGRTGCGKSTLCSLVPRLEEVTSGAVKIDGHDVKDLRLKSLRKHIGFALEDALLFSASVRENLALGHSHASDDELEAALRLAQAGFVYDLPWGLDTRIGEQGMTLSGGQRQRLALARAIVGNPPILVLDDPLSALDVHTEALVQQALVNVVGRSTTLISAHRPSTLALADRVAFLEDGKIAALGTHSELLESIPAYKDVLSQKAEVI